MRNSFTIPVIAQAFVDTQQRNGKVMINALTICLPTDDRVRATDFYRQGFGLDFVGDPQDDGLPEPLQFLINDHTVLMLIPRNGFEYTLGGALIADPTTHSSLLSISAETRAEVDELYARSVAGGANALEAPNQKPWGYIATIADPDGHPWLIRSN
jgi:predicted lactoylglutathione lyase